MLVSTLGYGTSAPSGRIAFVQLHRTRGARFHVSGIPWTAGRGALSRIYAAFETCDLPRITGAFTLHIRPYDRISNPTVLDVPIALAMLAHAGIVPQRALTNLLSAGEVELDGHIHAPELEGPHHALRFSDAADVHAMLMPDRLGRELAPHVHGATAHRLQHLQEAVAFLNEERILPAIAMKSNWSQREKWPSADAASIWDSTRMSPAQQHALIAAAAARLPLLIIGSAGTGKSQMARALHELLPALSNEQHSTVEALHRMRGMNYPLTEQPPLRTPHHKCSASGLIGATDSAGNWVPGELSLAHEGLLCLDEFSEFARDCIEALRGPLEHGELTLVRARNSQTASTASWLVATSNPCPCGRFHDGPTACACTAGRVRNYLSRISGPVADRFPLHLETQTQPLAHHPDSIDLTTARHRVGATCKRLAAASETQWAEDAAECLAQHSSRFRTSARGQLHLKRIAEVHAAMRQAPNSGTIKIEACDAAFASQMRIFDRPLWWEKPELS